MKNEFCSNPNEYFGKLAELLKSTEATALDGTASPMDEACRKGVELIAATKTSGAKVMLIGNGGSAAIVSHIQNDLCDSAGVRAIVFNEPPFLTAVANDHGYETFFEQAVRLWAEKGDLLVAVSSSGRSKSILRAIEAGKEKGVISLTFSGFRPDNPLRQLGDINFYVKSEVYGFVETAHAVIGHFLTDSVIHSEQSLKAAR